ncbi:MAG: glycoside hydrolase family 97 catalytic domain-containing protein, partial [Bacteroidota bacterium]
MAQTSIPSPNGQLLLIVEAEEGLSFSVQLDGKSIVQSGHIDLEVNEKWVLGKQTVQEKQTSYKGEIEVPFSYKQKVIQDEYNALRLDYAKDYGVEFRVYDLGVAYRITLQNGEETITTNEKLELQFADDYKMWSSLIEGYGSSYEEVYSEHTVSDFPEAKNSYTPLLLAGEEVFVHITDADVYDYPHLFLKKGIRTNSVQATFPPFPLKTEMEGSRGSTIVEAADYSAKTNGNRNLPWRLFHVVKAEKQLLESNLVYQLSRAGEEQDFSWVKPGKVAWDWWNAFNLYGVDFETGFNTQTWQAYIDFAAQNGLEYIIMDEGWSASLENIKEANPNVNLPFLIEYGKQRNVGIVLWSTWRGLLNDWTVLDQFQEWGVAGIKVDFMDRADQWMVNFYEKVAQETAKRKLFVDYHGAYKPAGMRRQYPNILSYEGVCGLEYNKWSNKAFPKNTTKIPFIRMITGP